MDFLNLEEELDHTVHSQLDDQGKADKVQEKKDPKAHKSTQNCLETAAAESQMLVPQTKQETEPSCKSPLSQAMSAEQGQIQKWTQNGQAPQKDIQGDVTNWILV